MIIFKIVSSKLKCKVHVFESFSNIQATERIRIGLVVAHIPHPKQTSYGHLSSKNLKFTSDRTVPVWTDQQPLGLSSESGSKKSNLKTTSSFSE